MIDPASFLLFLAAGLALNMTPGPDMLFVAGNGLSRGPRAGLAAALGVSAGCLVHVAAAAIGVSAILAASALAFDLLRWAGAAYLLWCAWSAVRAPTPARAGTAPVLPLTTVFRQGALTNALNPKVGLFFLAFLPQFVPADAARPGLTAMLLGLLFIATSTLVNGAVGLAAGRLGTSLVRHPGLARKQGWLTGGIYGALALRLLFLERQPA